MADTTNAYRPRRTIWVVSLGQPNSRFYFGQINEADPNMQFELDPITRGTSGKHVLGFWITRLNAMPKIKIPDTTLAAFKKACPWYASGASVPLVPSAVNPNLYTYADLLTFHPLDMAADTTEDINFNKAVPMSPTANVNRNGVKDDEWELGFHVFPDLTKLQAATPTVVYGSIGDVIT